MVASRNGTAKTFKEFLATAAENEKRPVEMSVDDIYHLAPTDISTDT